MTTTARRSRTALLGLAAALPLALCATAPAGAEGTARPRITASVTDATPASGETFRVSGRLTRDGDGLADRTVKVQTLRGGSWTDLTGARMATSDSGRYSLRVILSQTGERTLRVVGKLPGRDAHRRFTVVVH